MYVVSDFDPDEAQRLRQVLAAHHGDSIFELMLTVGSMLGSSETMPTRSRSSARRC